MAHVVISPHFSHPLLHIPENVFWLIERRPLQLHLGGFPHLAVDAGIAACLGRNVVDPQALSQTP